MKSLIQRFTILSAILVCVLFLHAASVPAQTNSASSSGVPAKYVSIDFNNVDINVFIRFISELTGRNFVIDQRVRGKVTIISPTKISVEEAYKVFQSVLEVHGFAAVKAGDVTKIIPAPNARTKDIDTMFREERLETEDKVVTQIIHLKYADPNEIKRLFTPFVSKSSVIQPYDPSNMLIVTDVYSNITRLLDILEVIDVVGAGHEISILPLDHADSKNMVRLLTSVFAPIGRRKKGSTQDLSKFVADDRTNSIVALATENNMFRIKRLVSMLDKEMPKGKEKFRVYYLENATAEELAQVLQSLSQKQAKTKTKGKKQAPIVSENVMITADKATNSLIIMAEKDDYIVLEDIIRKLDIPRSMVYIECLIMEVNVNKDFNIGTEWMAMGEASYEGREGGVGGGFSGGGDQPWTNTLGLINPSISEVTGAAVGTLPAGFSLGVFSEAVKIGNVVFPNLAAVVAAFRRDKKVHILSTPQILTTDNEEATIMVGKNIPYQTRAGTGTTTVSEVYYNYEYKDVGITLKITPQISKDRLIRLKIFQEVQKLDQVQTTSDFRPTTLKRTVETTAIVKDKNTIVLGGLIEDSLSQTDYKVPCLGDIPWLGWAFKSFSSGREKTNLFIFLTPHVINTPEEAGKIYDEKMDKAQSVEEGNIKLYEQRKDILDIEEDIKHYKPEKEIETNR